MGVLKYSLFSDAKVCLPKIQALYIYSLNLKIGNRLDVDACFKFYFSIENV